MTKERIHIVGFFHADNVELMISIPKRKQDIKFVEIDKIWLFGNKSTREEV